MKVGHFPKNDRSVQKLTLWISATIAFNVIGFSPVWANENITSCRNPEDSLQTPLIGWAKLMQKTMNVQLETQRILIPSAEADIPLEVDEVEDVKIDSRTPSQKYALTAGVLRKFGIAARAEARKCRTPRGGRRICGGLSTSKGLCYQGVKDTLVRMGWASSRWSDAHAVSAHRRDHLTKRGFKNIIAEGVTSQSAPLGAILVYSGGPKGYGHIEIRTGKYQYCSDFCQAAPIDDLLKRKLVGIYVRK